jgi:hypothetical protein
MRKKEREASRVTVTPSRMTVTHAEAEAEAYSEREREAVPTDNSPNPNSLSFIDIPEIPTDMDAEAERAAATAYHRDKGHSLTTHRWRSWVLAAVASGRYAKRKKGPPTEAEVAAERRKCVERMAAESADAANLERLRA